MEKEMKPFGYTFFNNLCTIKLRFNEAKFMEAGLNKYGNYRYSNKGFIIFEITLDTRSEDYKELSSKLHSLKPAK